MGGSACCVAVTVPSPPGSGCSEGREDRLPQSQHGLAVRRNGRQPLSLQLGAGLVQAGTVLDAAQFAVGGAGGTAHAESVKITYDPSVVRYDQLLRIFFAVVADPTLKNRQGPDVGAHYRSAIVPMNAEQSAVASAYIAQLGKAGIWKNPIVTRIEAYKAFYPAEAYHQDYMAINPTSRYIVRWDAPKVAAFKAMYPGFYRAGFLKDGG